jgi:anti-sigma factor RsiW
MNRDPLIDQILDEFRKNPARPCNTCESEEVLVDFVRGALDPEDAQRVKAHVESCGYGRMEVMRIMAERAILLMDSLKGEDSVEAIMDILGPEGLRKVKKVLEK